MKSNLCIMPKRPNMLVDGPNVGDSKLQALLRQRPITIRINLDRQL